MRGGGETEYSVDSRAEARLTTRHETHAHNIRHHQTSTFSKVNEGERTQLCISVSVVLLRGAESPTRSQRETLPRWTGREGDAGVPAVTNSVWN